jgi:rubrerythrin
MKEQNSTENPDIRFHCIDAILVSLSIEKQGLKFYEKAARKSQDPKVQKMFQYLADEEKEHIQTLKEKAQFLQPVLHKKAASRKQVENFIAEKLKGKVFPEMKGGKGADFSSDAEALDLGIQSEQKSIKMLNELLLKEKKLEVRAIFMHLLVEEKRHLACLEELRKSFP